MSNTADTQKSSRPGLKTGRSNRVHTEWAGSKSWIPIDFITPTDADSDQAVLDDFKFNQVLDENLTEL